MCLLDPSALKCSSSPCFRPDSSLDDSSIIVDMPEWLHLLGPHCVLDAAVCPDAWSGDLMDMISIIK